MAFPITKGIVVESAALAQRAALCALPLLPSTTNRPKVSNWKASQEVNFLQITPAALSPTDRIASAPLGHRARAARGTEREAHRGRRVPTRAFVCHFTVAREKRGPRAGGEERRGEERSTQGTAAAPGRPPRRMSGAAALPPGGGLPPARGSPAGASHLPRDSRAARLGSAQHGSAQLSPAMPAATAPGPEVPRSAAPGRDGGGPPRGYTGREGCGRALL